jgi:hypothetical protein
MQNKVFRARYPFKLYLGLFFMIPMEIYLLWQIFSGRHHSAETILLAAIFGLAIPLVPLIFISRIIFSENSFTLEKLGWPSKTIDYADVVDIGATMLKTRKGNVSFQAMTNSDELREILDGLVKKGMINRYQIEGKALAAEVMSRKAIVPAAIIAFILWGIALVIWPYEDSFFRDLSLVGFFIPAYIVAYKILKDRADDQ